MQVIYTLKKAFSGERLVSHIGRLYLYRRYKAAEQVERELRTRYEGRYYNAGLALLFDLLMAISVVVAVALLTGVLYLVSS